MDPFAVRKLQKASILLIKHHNCNGRIVQQVYERVAEGLVAGRDFAIEEVIDASHLVPHPHSESIEWATWTVSDVLRAVIVMLADEQITCGVKDSPYIGDKLIIYSLVGIKRQVIVPAL